MSRLPHLLALLCAATAASLLGAEGADWPDGKGRRFKGEPAETLGPFALFRTGAAGGRTVALQALSSEECVRFHRELTAARTAAADGDAASPLRGSVSRELQGRVLQLQKGKLQPVALDRRPEPSIYVLITVAPRDSGALSRIVNAFFVNYRRIQRAYPGQLEAVYYNRRQAADQNLETARSRNMPWLVADPRQSDRLKTFDRLVPFETSAVIAVSRNGVPLLGASGHDEPALIRFMDQLAAFLSLVQSDDLRNWRDRLHYRRAVRPVEHAEDEAGPELLGHPLRAEPLRRLGIARVQARLAVGADGRVGEVRLVPVPGLSEKNAASLAEAVRRAVFLPAINRGQSVAGTYDYDFAVPAADAELEAIRAWLNLDPSRELPIKQWLVLKTFKVEQQGFLEVDHVTEDGVAVLKPVKALQGKAATETDLRSQKTAFAYDWFSPEECRALRPAAGQVQKIDGTDYVWKRFVPDDRAVELNTGWDKEQYCYCYAWTEIEVDREQPALLGLGSDDGVKIWLNGEPLLEKWVQRPLKLDEDVVPLRLKQGRNQLMLKVQNIWGEWRFSVRLILQGPAPAATKTKS